LNGSNALAFFGTMSLIIIKSFITPIHNRLKSVLQILRVFQPSNFLIFSSAWAYLMILIKAIAYTYKALVMLLMLCSFCWNNNRSSLINMFNKKSQRS
jgi:hypothetical protein